MGYNGPDTCERHLVSHANGLESALHEARGEVVRTSFEVHFLKQMNT
jgi:hypothetical protein